MSLTYTSIELYTIDDSGAQIRPTKTYIPATSPQTTMSIGEKVRMSIQVTQTVGKILDGDIFLFNTRLFAASTLNPTPIPTGGGWRIDIEDNGGLVGVATLVTKLATAANNDPQQNITLTNIVIGGGDTTLDFDFEFYVTSDLAEWIGEVVSSNESRWLKDTTQNSNNLNNNASSAFSRLSSFIEVVMFQADNNLNPLTFIDPIVRDPAAPQLNTFSIPVAAKFYDERVGGGSVWLTSTTKEDNFMEVFTVTGGNVTNATEINHKGFPFRSSSTLSNFDIVDSRLVRDTSMDVHIEINSPDPLNDYTHLLAILIRVDNVVDSVDFFSAYSANIALIPKLDAATAWINGEVFGTPSAWTTAAGLVTIDYKLDGSKLDPSGQYHIITVLIENNTDYSSSHISGKLSPVLYPISLPTTITGIIDTYNNSFTDVNDLSLTSFERYKLKIEVDSTGYTDFATDLQEIRLRTSTNTPGVTNFSNNIRFQSGAGSGPNPITITSAPPLYTFEAEFRSYYNLPAATPFVSTNVWELVFEQTTPGGVEEVIIGFTQIIRHRGDDVARLTGMRVLDYADFQIAVLTEKFFICTDDDKVVIEVTKSGVPNMNLIGLFLANAIPLSQPLQSVEEEEAYVSAFLPTLTSLFLEDVDVDFAATLGADNAYFVVDTSTLQQGSSYFVEALCYNI